MIGLPATLIEQRIIGVGGSADEEFSSIASVYTNLAVEIVGWTSSDAEVEITVGSGTVDTAANYNQSWAHRGASTNTGGNQAESALTENYSHMAAAGAAGAAESPNVFRIIIFDYASTSVAKHAYFGGLVVRNNTQKYFAEGVSMWETTGTAIDIVNVGLAGAATFDEGTLIRLLGIPAVAAAGGGGSGALGIGRGLAWPGIELR